jgi:hypothetical protein
MKLIIKILSLSLVAVSVIGVAAADAGAEPADRSAPRVPEAVTHEAPGGEEMDPGDVEPHQNGEPLVGVDILRIAPDLMEDEAEDEEAVNEIVFERFTLRGAAVQWFKTDNLLQLFNPFAPERYGSGELNLAYDLITGRPKGMTILSIDFGGRKDRGPLSRPVQSRTR